MRYLQTFENLNKKIMVFYHGGNLDEYKAVIAHKKGRFEFGAGLYCTDDLNMALKYSKGGRKLYQLFIEEGVDIQYAFLEEDKCRQFIKNYIKNSKKKEVIERLEKFITNGKVKAYVFNNIILNGGSILPTKTDKLRSFLIENGIDYEIIDKSGKMLVLYNMEKIKDSKIIKPNELKKFF